MEARKHNGRSQVSGPKATKGLSPALVMELEKPLRRGFDEVMEISLRKESLADSLVSQLVNMIREKKLKPGDFLPSQRVLAKQFGVGHPTIREAIRSLSSMGLVKVQHGRKTQVQKKDLQALVSGFSTVIELTDADVVSLLEAKDIIETRCAELAVERIGREELRHLENCLKSMEANRNNARKYAAADYEFHYVIVRAAKNPVINELMKIVGGMIRGAIERTVLYSALSGRDIAMRYHYRIFAAIEARQGSKAASIVHEHILETIRRFSAGPAGSG